MGNISKADAVEIIGVVAEIAAERDTLRAENEELRRKYNSVCGDNEHHRERAYKAEGDARELRAKVAELEAKLAECDLPPSRIDNCIFDGSALDPNDPFRSLIQLRGENEDGSFRHAAVNLKGYAVIPRARLEAAEARAAGLEQRIRKWQDLALRAVQLQPTAHEVGRRLHAEYAALEAGK